MTVDEDITETGDKMGYSDRFSRFQQNEIVRAAVKIFLAFEFIIVLFYFLNGVFNDTWLIPWTYHWLFWKVILRTNTVRAMIIAAIPIMLTAMGATFNERVGIINIGLEGIMIWGAWTSVYVTYQTGSPTYGAISGVLIGIIVSLVHGLFTITLKAEQIVTGVAINLTAAGMTQVLSSVIYGQVYQFLDGFETVNYFEWPLIGPILNLLSITNYYETPIIGPLISIFPDLVLALNRHHPLIYLGLLLIPVSHVFLFKTKYGLRLRVIGEHPEAAATAGINVKLYQYIALIISGALSGLGGAALGIGNLEGFRDGAVGGRGFIALAAMIFGKWTIFGSVLGSMFFGYFLSLSISINISLPKFFVPGPFLQMIPFIFSIMALAGFIGKAIPPKNIGKPYDPTE